ncbi:aldose 1-epimerase [Bacillus sp. JJ1521]|uniref:aldose 1-epimerase n=1 Tax=Bacillus sp. JJ1521 TaxID=3122957 RepID=UPI003000EAA6
MNRYSVENLSREGFQVIHLIDKESDSKAEIVPGIGNNLFQFKSFGKSIISAPDNLETLKNETFANFKYGTPILFPPNRVKDGSFTFKGRKYHLPINEPPSNHLHGELCSRPWEISDYGTSNDKGAYVTCTFSYSKYPDILSYFPHELLFSVTYALLNGKLLMKTRITNKGEDEAPFAFGLHPYFNIPYEKEEEILLTIPSENEWPVTNEAFVTGEPSNTSFSKELNKGVNIANYPKLGCSLVTIKDHNFPCRIDLKNNDYSIFFEIDKKFPFVVLFRPDWASSYSIEPYTYVTDAFNLPFNEAVSGVQGLNPGESLVYQTKLWIKTKAL